MSAADALSRRVQTDPASCTNDEIMGEVRRLMALNRRHGPNAMRTATYLRLLALLGERERES